MCAETARSGSLSERSEGTDHSVLQVGHVGAHRAKSLEPGASPRDQRIIMTRGSPQ